MAQVLHPWYKNTSIIVTHIGVIGKMLKRENIYSKLLYEIIQIIVLHTLCSSESLVIKYDSYPILVWAIGMPPKMNMSSQFEHGGKWFTSACDRED